MFIFESKLDIRIFCVHIFYKRFQLLTRITGDKNIIIIPLINLGQKSSNQKFFKMTKKRVS